MKAKKILYKSIKITGWILAVILFLLLLIVVLIQIPAVQNFARGKVVIYLENKIKTKVEIGKLSIDFPKQLVLEKVYFQDQRKDTLLAGDKIRVDISLFKLLSNTVEINYLELEGIRANIYRLNEDTVFNYDYIVKAFTAPATTDTTAPMKFKLGKIELKRITTTFKDDNSGNDVYFYLGSLITTIDKFDPTRSEYAIPSFAIADITARVRQYKPLIEPKPAVVVEAESNKPIQTKLELGTVDFNNINFNYINNISVVSAQVNLGTLSSSFGKMDLSKLFIPMKKIQLSNTYIKVLLGKSPASREVSKEVDKLAVAQANNPWLIALNNVSFNNNEIQFDNDNTPPAKTGMDYRHLHIKGMTVEADSMEFTPTIFKGNIQQLAFTEKSGFNLLKFQTRFFYSDQKTTLENLFLQTDKTILKNRVALSYPSISLIAEKPGDIFVDANLDHCKLAVKDILIFAPMLATNLKGNEQAVFSLNAKAKGYIKDFSMPVVEFSGLGNTAFQISGNIKGLPDMKKTLYDIKIVNFTTTKNDIEKLLPPKTIPSNIRIPEKIFAKGFFKGSIQNFTTSINAQTTNGNADITALMSNGGKSYTAKATLNKMDLGYLLKQEQNIGKVSLTANVKGTGFDYKTMNAVINANVKEAAIKGYTYTNLLLDATVEKGTALIQSSINDPNIRFQLNATAGVSNTYPAIKLNMQLDTIDLYALHLLKDPIQMSGTVNADFANTNPDALQGTLQLYNVSINNNHQKLYTDTITLMAAKTDSAELIQLHSEMAEIYWKGNYKLTEVALALEHTINRYYNIPGFKDSAFTPQQWQMNMLLKPSSPLVLQFVPSLKGSDTVNAKLSFNSTQNNLDLYLQAPKIQFNDQVIEQLNATASAKEKQFDYSISMNKAGSKGFQLYETSLSGYIVNNEVITSLLIKDKQHKNRYHVAGTLNQVYNGIKFSLHQDSLLLNYDTWQVSKDNFIQYDSTGVIANDFMISNKDQSLRINSESSSTQAPIDIAFTNFRIKTLTDFAEQDSLLMDGIINGKAIVKNATSNPVFTSDLQIKDFSYKKDTIGNISLKVDNETANAFNTDIRIEGNGNDVRLSGKYFTGERKMDLQLNIANLNVATITPFSAGQLKDAGGNLKGDISIAGTTDKPVINGDIHFENAFIVPTISGERFTLPDEKINISPQGLNFNQFTLVDSAGNKAIINGDVFTTDFKNYKFAVDLNANDFNLVNTAKANNALFYGKLNVDARVKVRGNLQAPSIDANIKANKLTDFTLVLPGNDPEVVSREGVVNFVDMDAPADSTKKIDFTDTLFNTTAFAGMNLSAIIETDTAALFTLIIDERSGDALALRGKADLAAGVDESGKLSLTGNYEIQRGSYQLSFSFIKRKFDIQKGSVITWTGDPTSANIDITALYKTLAPPIDLVEAQLAGLSVTELNTYKQRIPIQVLLKMKGELLKPQITFDILLPSDQVSRWPVVDAKLEQIRTDESELNKQVFALLLLNRFVGENPLQSDAGITSTSTLIRQSVSSILADQLNQLAGSLIKGVDVNFGINSADDYTTGTQATRTDLTVGVSKSLLNDRIKVSVGSNFELEGPANTNQSASTIAGDVAVDYQLSKDGRYILRAYRKNQYEGVIEGQVIETGLTFIFTLDYDHLRELFQKKNAETKQLKKEAKENKKNQAEQKIQ